MPRKDPELPKEAVLHAQNDMRNIPEGRSITQNVIRHAQEDLRNLSPDSPAPPDRGFLGRMADQLRESWDNLYIGKEHAVGMLKLGFHELTNALTPMPDSNIRPMEEPGVFGNEAMPHIQDTRMGNDAPRGQDKDRSRNR